MAVCPGTVIWVESRGRALLTLPTVLLKTQNPPQTAPALPKTLQRRPGFKRCQDLFLKELGGCLPPNQSHAKGPPGPA